MTPRTCDADGCARPYRKNGYCAMHAQRLYHHGTIELVGRMASLETRLWAKVNKTETCWLWTGGDNGTGYGQIGLGDKKLYVHRLSWEWANGPIPDGLQVDHLCMIRRCVNPAHMELVTPKVNTNRGYGAQVSAALQRDKTHCAKGHPYDEANTRWTKAGNRLCRACCAAAGKAWRESPSGKARLAVYAERRKKK